jgi:hypothetical protein
MTKGIKNRGSQVHHVKRGDLLAKEHHKEINQILYGFSGIVNTDFKDFPYIVHSKDGTGYFQDKQNKWCMAPQNLDGSYDWHCVSYVEDMEFDGVGEKDIANVKQFINSIEEGEYV